MIDLEVEYRKQKRRKFWLAALECFAALIVACAVGSVAVLAVNP